MKALDEETLYKYLTINQNLKTDTAKAYLRHIKDYLKTSRIKPEDSTEELVLDYLSRTNSPKNKLSSLKKLDLFLLSHGHTTKPFAIHLRIKDKTSRRIINPDDYEKIMNNLCKLGLKERLITYLLISTGVRFSEALELKMIDLLYSEFGIIFGKGDKSRNILVDSFLHDLLLEYKATYDLDDNDYVFADAKGKMSEYRFRKTFNKAMEIIGTPDYTPHHMRHFFITHIVRTTGPESAQLLGGHSWIKQTKWYIHGHMEYLLQKLKEKDPYFNYYEEY